MNHGMFFLLNYIVSLVSLKVVSIVICAYDLMIIEDEDTPLAAEAPKGNYYVVTAVIIVAAALIALLVTWLVKRSQEAKRLKELNKKLNKTAKTPLKIRDIKDQIAQAEIELSSDCL